MFGLPTYAVDTEVDVAFGLSVGPPVGAMLPLSSAVRKTLTSVSVTLESGGLGAFSLEFEAWDTARQELTLLGKSQLAVDNHVEIALGHTSSATLIHGPITDLTAGFSSGGLSLSISGYDVRHVLRQGIYLRVFPEQSELEIAAAICKARGLSVEIEKGTDPPPLKVMRQAGWQSDYELIGELLDRVGYLLDVDGKTVVIREPSLKPTNPFAIPTYSPIALTRFSGTDSSAEQIDGVIVLGYDPESGKKIEGTAGTVKSLTSPPRVITLHRDVDTQAGADRIAQSELDRRKKKKLTASADLRGDATLVPGGWVEITDVGPFSGDWRITRAVHTWNPGAGYTTALSLEQEA